MARGKPKAEPAPLIYVDTCVYVDLLTMRTALHPDTQEPRWMSAKALFDAVNDGRVRLAASSLVDAEVCCFSRIRDHQEVHDKARGWFDAPSTRYAEVDRFLARDAARISKALAQRFPHAKQPNPADAVHMAVAVRLGCDYLMTHDEGFPLGHKVDDLVVQRPETVWQLTVFDLH